MLTKTIPALFGFTLLAVLLGIILVPASGVHAVPPTLAQTRANPSTPPSGYETPRRSLADAPVVQAAIALVTLLFGMIAFLPMFIKDSQNIPDD